MVAVVETPQLMSVGWMTRFWVRMRVYGGFRARPVGCRRRPGSNVRPVVGTAYCPWVGGLSWSCLCDRHVPGTFNPARCVPADAHGCRSGGGGGSEGGVRIAY